MPKKSEAGNVILILLILFLILGSIATFMVYKTINTGTQKIAQQSDSLAVALKSEYENPFDKNTQYENPFNDYQNPFDNLK